MTTCFRRVIFALALWVLVLTGCGEEELPRMGVSANTIDKGQPEKLSGPAGFISGYQPDGANDLPIDGLAVTRRDLGTDPDGNTITEYQLTNSGGMQVTLINYGAIVRSVRVPDRHERYVNVTLGFDAVEQYCEPGPYFGAICGRYANRIAGGRFRIGETEHVLATNDNGNHLHGGIRGFNRRIWTAEVIKGATVGKWYTARTGSIGVRFHLDSPDGEENYPGRLSVDVIYWLTETNELKIQYQATTDKATVLNLTNHCYWNLAGGGTDVLDHELTIGCDHYLPVDKKLLPTGARAAVSGTPMDFLEARTIGSRIADVSGGYDHCYVRSDTDGALKKVAEVHHPGSGRVMEVLTTEPGLQFYSGNFLDGSPQSGGHDRHGGFCLECQHFPDSPNRPDFPTTLLQPGETYKQMTVYRFLVRRDDDPDPEG